MPKSIRNTSNDYLLKFVSEKEHAESLLNGQLFTRPAEYYIKLENKKGQGDETEAMFMPHTLLHKNYNMPIFCMMLICEEDIDDGVARIDQRIIEDFGASHVAIIPFESFHKAIGEDVENISYRSGIVDYRMIRNEETLFFLFDSSGMNLFIKNPDLCYQKEFRIVIQEHIYQKPAPMIEHKKYQMHMKIENGEILSISDLPFSDGYYYTKVE